jgi:hypothetical protein
MLLGSWNIFKTLCFLLTCRFTKFEPILSISKEYWSTVVKYLLENFFARSSWPLDSSRTRSVRYTVIHTTELHKPSCQEAPHFLKTPPVNITPSITFNVLYRAEVMAVAHFHIAKMTKIGHFTRFIQQNCRELTPPSWMAVKFIINSWSSMVLVGNRTRTM